MRELTVEQAADLIGIDPSGVRRYARLGRIAGRQEHNGVNEVWRLEAASVKKFARRERRRGRKPAAR